MHVFCLIKIGSTYILQIEVMKIIRLVYICILLATFQQAAAQSPVLFEDSFTEMTTAQDKFSIYLDSIDEYLYRDIDLTTKALEECEKIVEQGTELQDSLLFQYVISQIYFEYSLANPLGAFKKIIDNENLGKSKELTDAQIESFNYLKCFTLHSIGDLEAAQKEYYASIERGKLAKDTNSVVSNLYSLGQLYSDEKDFEASIKCFVQVLDYCENFKIRASTRVLNDLELCEAYTGIKEFDKALETLERADKISDENGLDVLKFDILILKGKIYLAQEKITAADAVYDELVGINKGSQDQNSIVNIQKFLGELYHAKKMYSESLNIYKEIRANADSTNLDLKIEALKKMNVLSKEMNNFKAAHEYLLTYNEVKDEKKADEKRQKTAYLKIKFDSEQKEKDNHILSAELIRNQAERKYLYTLIALFGLFLVILFGAFYQKARYNKKLEAEVQRRTVKLKKSNDLLNETNNELDEFNRILSHDLKEPLRSIVSFSQLASRNISNTTKTQEYLAIVAASGEQLHQLIDDVNLFQNMNSIHSEEKTPINIQILLGSIINQVQAQYLNKQIKLVSNANSVILGAPEILKSIFLNLIDNSAKYNENKTVSISINYELKDDMHHFEIEDNGIGIAPEYHQRIFEMFKRLNIRNVYTGSGLGLSIVKKLAEKIGGDISLVRSEEEIGSVFLFSFPVSKKTD